MRAGWWVLMVLVFGGLFPLSAQESPPLVRRIELRTDVDLPDPGAVYRLIDIEVGEPLDRRSVRQTLRNLEVSDWTAEVEVWSRREADGLVAVVAFKGSTMVEEIHFEGRLGLKRDQLEAVVEQGSGQQLIGSRVLRSVFALQDLYERQGYVQARVRVDVQTEPKGHRCRVVFEVDSGERRTIGGVSWVGAEGFPPRKLSKVLGLKAGKPYRKAQVREGVERLEEWLLNHNFYSAEVQLREVDTSTPTTVDLEVLLERGPEVSFDVTGWPASKLGKPGLLPVSGIDERDDTVLVVAEDRIQKFMQGKGYYRSQVDADYAETVEDSSELGTRVSILVEPGSEYKLRELSFDGNAAYPSERLAGLMQTSPFSLLQIGSGRLVDEILQEDLETLESFYALSGWRWVEVGPPEVTEIQGEGSGGARSLSLEIPIVEGRQSRVVDLEVTGAAEIELETLLEDLPLVAGGPYHPQRLEEALDRIRSLYEWQGYSGALVTAETDPNEDGTLVDVSFQVQEGLQQRLDRVIVRGSRRLQLPTVLGVAGLRPGEPLSRGRLIEVQQALYRLGIFSRVSVELAPEGDDPGQRDVILRLSEGDEQRFAYGLGYDSEEGVGGLIGYSHRNLFGRALRFQLDIRTSEQSEDYRLLLSRPFWRRGRLPGTQKLYVTSLDEQRTSFDVEQRGLEVELGWNRGASRYSLFFDYRTSDLTLAEDVVLSDADLPEGGDGRELQDIDILSATPRWSWDGRDDPLDPTRGSLISAQLEYALPVDGLSTEDFVKVFGQFSQYWPLRRAGVLAFSLRGGLIEPLGETSISIAERFYSGGSTTHRAYDRDELGIPGETLDSRANPIGGNGMVLVNLDWRFPIAGAFGGTLFADFGNVWSDWHDIDPSEGKTGVGIGARFASPVGPVRLDIAWKLDREPEESETQVFFAFGYAF